MPYHQSEADFAVRRNNVVEEIYQVSYDISKEKTRRRELFTVMTRDKQFGTDLTACPEYYYYEEK